MQKVNLFISCKNLSNVERFGDKSDPFCRVYQKEENANGSEWKLRDETEKRPNELSPQFVDPVPIFYSFEKSSELKFEVMDAEVNEKHRIIGEFTVPLNQILRAKNSEKKGTLQVFDNDGRVIHKDRGTIRILAETDDTN